MKLFVLVILTLQVTFSFGTFSTEWISKRHGRFFGQTVTKLLVDNLVVTSVVPSSCVAIEPSLPPCRGFRFLNFASPDVEEISAPKIAEKSSQGEVESSTTALSASVTATPPLPLPSIENLPDIIDREDAGTWGEYFNFIRGVTVTKTATRLLTETVMDPNRVITFSVKHCLPSKLPFQLPKCVDANQRPILPDKIIPTTTVSIESTTMPNEPPIESISIDNNEQLPEL